MEFVEPFAGEVLARVWQNEVAVADALLFLPAGVKDRRVDESHPRDVRIGFGGYVESAGAGSFDHGETFERIAQTRTVDVHDVERCACDGGCSDNFTYGLNRRSRLDTA